MSKPEVNNCRHSQTHSFPFGETVLRNSVFLEIVAPELSAGRSFMHTVFFRIRSLAQQKEKK